jgi:hypothetical protein
MDAGSLPDILKPQDANHDERGKLRFPYAPRRHAIRRGA